MKRHEESGLGICKPEGANQRPEELPCRPRGAAQGGGPPRRNHGSEASAVLPLAQTANGAGPASQDT